MTDLDTAIGQWNTYRQRSGYSVNTVRSGSESLKAFLAITGNIQVRSLGPHHGEMFLAAMLTKGYKPATINLRLSMVSKFAEWCRHRRLMTANQNPLSTTRWQTVELKPRRRVPVQDFGRLLDAAVNPQARILIALGLYLFTRSSEATFLKVGDVDLTAGMVRVYQPKTKRWDDMPICAELDDELRRWLTWYAQDQPGPLQGDWYLIPARRVHRIDIPVVGPEMVPTNKMRRTSERIHAALREIGWEVSGDDMEGCHTLRRSGARALYDELVERQDAARDKALRLVQSMLHHKSVTQTETYIGLEADRETRDVLFKGQRMFTRDTENVVALPERDLSAVGVAGG